MSGGIRTDLALEARQAKEGFGELRGVALRESRRGDIALTEVEILSTEGEAALGMPKGRYVTLEPKALLRREEDSFGRTCEALAETLRNFLNLPSSAPVLVAGLGNRDITPDAIGPLTLDSLMVTRHLRQELPEYFGAFRPVSGICSGVLGTTGIESGDIIAALCRRISPAAVIAVDALAARGAHRLCRSIQITDAGITPGSGVGNARQALNRKTLGVPVIALGVPTVIDAQTLISDLGGGYEKPPEAGSMIVTPRDIDKMVRDTAKLMAYALNLALHEGITVEDIDMFLS